MRRTVPDRWRSVTALVGCMLTVTAALAACGGTPAASRTSPTPNTTAPRPHRDVHSGNQPWTRADHRRVRVRARHALVLYARPHKRVGAWYRQLQPYLSTAARQAYLGTDPANVPVSRVRSHGRVTRHLGQRLAWVRFRTDVGRYTVVLSRHAGQRRWQVDRFVPARNRP